jgi:hypothetical protein
VVDEATDTLRNSREPKIGADRGHRRHAEEQDHDRRHQRAATDACKADQQANQET